MRSDAKPIEKKSGPSAPTGLTPTAASAKGVADGKITGVTSAMEYSTSSDFASKTACAGTEVTGLKAGTYYVRYAETDTAMPGKARAVSVADGPEEQQEPEILVGDVNGNGKVDRADRMYLARALAGWEGYNLK